MSRLLQARRGNPSTQSQSSSGHKQSTPSAPYRLSFLLRPSSKALFKAKSNTMSPKARIPMKTVTQKRMDVFSVGSLESRDSTLMPPAQYNLGRSGDEIDNADATKLEDFYLGTDQGKLAEELKVAPLPEPKATKINIAVYEQQNRDYAVAPQPVKKKGCLPCF